MSYRWTPLGARELGTNLPQPGTLVALRHTVYRTVRFDEIPECMWTKEDHDAWDQRRKRPFLLVADGLRDGVRYEIRGRANTNFRTGQLVLELHAYPSEHFPMCSECSEPMPCRADLRREATEAAVEREMRVWARFSKPGACPRCGEEVRPRQQSETWPNIKVPGGPDVTFHVGRDDCAEAAARYDRQWSEETGQAPKLPEHPTQGQWRGSPNLSQSRLLESASRGDITGTLCRVFDMSVPGAPSIEQAMADPSAAGDGDLPCATWVWQPRVESRLRRWLGGLVDAGLIAEPTMPADPERDRGPHPYRLTERGQDALRAKERAA